MFEKVLTTFLETQYQTVTWGEGDVCRFLQSFGVRPVRPSLLAPSVLGHKLTPHASDKCQGCWTYGEALGRWRCFLQQPGISSKLRSSLALIANPPVPLCCWSHL